MCGIYAHLHYGNKLPKYSKHEILSARGPDATRIISHQNYECAFYRLAIVGHNGMQPFERMGVILMANAEIYNHKELAREHEIKCDTESDCEIIIHLYLKYGIMRTLSLLDGEFAIVLIDTVNGRTYVARDRTGVKPLYYTMVTGECFSFEIASNIRAMENPEHVRQIPPRLLCEFTSSSFQITPIQYYCAPTRDLYECLRSAVHKRITNSDRPVGFLLSGGLDSSYVLAEALTSGLLRHPPHVFTYGFEQDASDVRSAKLMVEFLKKKHGPDCLIHHIIIEDLSVGFEEIPIVIKEIETYDTTTIRASTPMKRLCKWISENTDVKVILSGEGSDELFGGYLYFMYAPNNDQFKLECRRLLDELHYFDNLRADRSSAAHGLEIRPPFLDLTLVTRVLESERLHCGENTKMLLREIIPENLLPPAIHLGRKEAFSDAVGLSWKKYIEDFAKEIQIHCSTQNKLRPTSATAAWFQTLFATAFGHDTWHILPHYWVPNQNWVDTGGESSATHLPLYTQKKEAQVEDDRISFL